MMSLSPLQTLKKVALAGATALLVGLAPAQAVPVTTQFDGQVFIDPNDQANGKDFFIDFNIADTLNPMGVLHSLLWTGTAPSPSLMDSFTGVTVTDLSKGNWAFSFSQDLDGPFSIDFSQITLQGGEGTVTWETIGDLPVSGTNFVTISGFNAGSSYSALISGTDPFAGNINFGPLAVGAPEVTPAAAILPLASIALALLVLGSRRRKTCD